MKILILTVFLIGIMTCAANAYYCPSGPNYYDCVMAGEAANADRMMDDANARYRASQYGYDYGY